MDNRAPIKKIKNVISKSNVAIILSPISPFEGSGIIPNRTILYNGESDQ